MSLTIVQKMEMFAREWMLRRIRELPYDKQEEACSKLYDELFDAVFEDAKTSKAKEDKNG